MKLTIWACQPAAPWLLFQYLTTFFKLLSAFRISSFDMWTCAEELRSSLLALITALKETKSQLPSLLCQASSNNVLSFICPTHPPNTIQTQLFTSLEQTLVCGSLFFSVFTHGPYSWEVLSGSTSHFPDMAGTLESQLRCRYLRKSYTYTPHRKEHFSSLSEQVTTKFIYR